MLAVLLAVLAEHPFFGVGGPQEMVYCTLDFGRITSQGSSTYEARLARLLGVLHAWAGANVPVVNPAFDLHTAGGLEDAIYDFLWRLGRPTVFLVDEVRGVYPAAARSIVGISWSTRRELCWGMQAH